MPYEKQHIFDILCERLRVQAAGGGGRQASSPQVVLPDAGASRASESSVPGDVARSQDSGKMVEFPRQVLELCAAKIAAEIRLQAPERHEVLWWHARLPLHIRKPRSMLAQSRAALVHACDAANIEPHAREK